MASSCPMARSRSCAPRTTSATFRIFSISTTRAWRCCARSRTSTISPGPIWKTAVAQNVLHAEIFFDPQAHTARGVAFATVIERHRPGPARRGGAPRHFLEADHVLSAAPGAGRRDAKPWTRRSTTRTGSSPSASIPRSSVTRRRKFKEVFARARAAGFLTVAHAGEEGPAAYVREALDELGIVRVDHGNRSLDDAVLVRRLAEAKTPLTRLPPIEPEAGRGQGHEGPSRWPR